MLTGEAAEQAPVPLTAPKGVVLVPAEQVLLLSVALPGLSAAQRRAAVAFAIEEHIATTLDEVHVTLGPALPAMEGPARWLVAVTGRATLPVTAAGRLVPDVLLLPIPQAGQWSVFANDARVLVRTPNGAGFGTQASALPYFHLAAGRPGIVLFAGQLDAQFEILQRAEMPNTLDPILQRFDLNAGRAPNTSFALTARWRPLAAVVAFATVAHLALVAADVWALRRIAATQRVALQASLAALGQPSSGNLDVDIAAILARANGPDSAGFIPLTARAFAAMNGAQGRVSASDLRFGADQNSLSIQLQAPDISTLQAVETALTHAGFQVTAGAATTGEGLAEQQLTLTHGGGT